MTQTPSNPSAEMKAELLPCPFCGTYVVSYADLTGDEGIEEGRMACGNAECGAMILAHYEGEAIKMWNTRTPQPQEGDLTREKIEEMRLKLFVELRTDVFNALKLDDFLNAALRALDSQKGGV